MGTESSESESSERKEFWTLVAATLVIAAIAALYLLLADGDKVYGAYSGIALGIISAILGCGVYIEYKTMDEDQLAQYNVDILRRIYGSGFVTGGFIVMAVGIVLAEAGLDDYNANLITIVVYVIEIFAIAITADHKARKA
jgi:hypothetical protein